MRLVVLVLVLNLGNVTRRVESGRGGALLVNFRDASSWSVIDNDRRVDRGSTHPLLGRLG